MILLNLKKYVYEKQPNGKRKRVSPFVFDETGTIIEIRQKAIEWAVEHSIGQTYDPSKLNLNV